MKSLTLNFLYLISFAFVSAFDTHAFTSLNNNKVMGFEDRTSNNLPIEKQAVDKASQTSPPALEYSYWWNNHWRVGPI